MSESLLSSMGSMEAVWRSAWSPLHWGNPLGLLFSFVLGSALGSFANVVIWRLPRGESVIKPASHCPHCATPIPPKYNVPIISFLALRGRTACCSQPIAPRYFVVELLSALILSVLYLLEGWSLAFLFHSAWMLLLIMLSVIDLEHYRLPNVLVAAGAVVSLIWMLLEAEQSWAQAGWGLLLGLGVGAATMVAGRIMKGRWSGVGDVKLATVLGFTFGPGRFLLLYLIGSLAALVFAAVRRTSHRSDRIPMGPFFALGAWVVILCGAEIVQWYMGLLL